MLIWVGFFSSSLFLYFFISFCSVLLKENKNTNSKINLSLFSQLQYKNISLYPNKQIRKLGED